MYDMKFRIVGLECVAHERQIPTQGANQLRIVRSTVLRGAINSNARIVETVYSS
jgi:hypothetical protein